MFEDVSPSIDRMEGRSLMIHCFCAGGTLTHRIHGHGIFYLHDMVDFYGFHVM